MFKSKNESQTESNNPLIISHDEKLPNKINVKERGTNNLIGHVITDLEHEPNLNKRNPQKNTKIDVFLAKHNCEGFPQCDKMFLTKKSALGFIVGTYQKYKHQSESDNLKSNHQQFMNDLNGESSQIQSTEAPATFNMTNDLDSKINRIENNAIENNKHLVDILQNIPDGEQKERVAHLVRHSALFKHLFDVTFKGKDINDIS